MTSLSDYLSLKKSFVFYGSYHAETRNKLIHMVFVPCIYTTALTFLSRVPLPFGIPGTAADACAATYALTFLAMEPTAGLLYAPVIGAMHHVGTSILTRNLNLAIGIHAVGWICQFIGHGVFEGRKPALLDNLLQSVHAAVFFVWLEFLFMLGYKPKLKAELDALIAAKIAEDKKKK